MQKGKNDMDNGKCSLGMVLTFLADKRNKMRSRLKNTIALGTFLRCPGQNLTQLKLPLPHADDKLSSSEYKLASYSESQELPLQSTLKIFSSVKRSHTSSHLKAIMRPCSEKECFRLFELNQTRQRATDYTESNSRKRYYRWQSRPAESTSNKEGAKESRQAVVKIVEDWKKNKDNFRINIRQMALIHKPYAFARIFAQNIVFIAVYNVREPPLPFADGCTPRGATTPT